MSADTCLPHHYALLASAHSITGDMYCYASGSTYSMLYLDAKLKFALLAAVPCALAPRFHIHEYERVRKVVLPLCSRLHGKQVETTFNIMDVKGAWLGGRQGGRAGALQGLTVGVRGGRLGVKGWSVKQSTASRGKTYRPSTCRACYMCREWTLRPACVHVQQAWAWRSAQGTPWGGPCGVAYKRLSWNKIGC